MHITKGLIIADPWIGYILMGQKTWEMRSTGTSFRGLFGLIKKGSGAIWGVARLLDVGASLSPEEMISTFRHHRIAEEQIRGGAVAKWTVPWKLADVMRLREPVPYVHKSGAVTWVELDPQVDAAISRQLDERELQSAVPTPRHEAQGLIASVPPIAAASTPPRHDERKNVFIGDIELTDGNMKHNHIYLRTFIEKFPTDAIGGSNRHEKAAREISVDWGDQEAVRTDIDGEKKFFRSRGWVRRFFEATGASAGDRVLIEETAPYCYRVTLKKQIGRSK